VKKRMKHQEGKMYLPKGRGKIEEAENGVGRKAEKRNPMLNKRGKCRSSQTFA